MEAKEEVAKILLEIKAVTINMKKPFRYASGIFSPIYCDNRLLLSYPERREKIVDYFVQTIKGNKIQFDVLAGVATAGIPHAAFLAERLSKPMVYVRTEKKMHGKQNVIEGRLEKGQRVLVIEDHISTGGSSAAAVKSVQEAGGKAEYCLAITTYSLPSAEKAFREINCKVITLTDFSTIISAAEQMGYITKEEKRKILEWDKDPDSWGRKMGFE